MELEMIIEISKTTLTLLLGALVLYFKFSTKAQTKAKQVQQAIAEVTAKAVIYIKEAEEQYKDTTNKGGEKFKLVCDKLHGLVPKQLQAIITYEMIENIVQNTFDEIEEYVRLQLDNSIDEE